MYKEFYDFRENPFELTIDPRFIFLTPSHRRIVDAIIDGVQNRKGFISVVGEAGTGKTVLMHYGVDQLDKKIKTVYLFHTTISFNGLIKTILQDLGVSIEKKNKQGLIDELIHHARAMAAKEEGLVLIIDEAQDLPLEVMEEIEKYLNPESFPAQIIFIGQTKFEERLRSEEMRSFRQHLCVRHRIQPLTLVESKAYIDHRLRLVGRDSLGLFTQGAVSAICDYAEGIPRTLNTVCDNALLRGFKLLRKKIDADIIGEVIKELEGPRLKGFMPSSSARANKFYPGSAGLRFLTKRVPMILAILICLCGIVYFTDRYVWQRPMKTGETKSLENLFTDIQTENTNPPSNPASFPMIKPSPPLRHPSGEDRLKEVVTVKEGETLFLLAQKYYRVVNETILDLILNYNPEIKDIDLIWVNQKIKMPAITEELLILQSDGPTYNIHAGTFGNTNAAKLFSEALLLKGKKVEILTRKVSPRENWYRVVIGPFDKKEDVLKTIGLLKEKGQLPLFKSTP